MKIDIAGIELVRGEFQVLTPETTGLNVPEQKAILVIGCNYVLKDARGRAVAQGVVTNSAEGQVRPSEETLAAFERFYSMLEQDVLGALSAEKREDDGNILARYMGK